MSEIECVAKAICNGAGKSVNKTYCAICINGPCIMWKEFREEARMAVKALDKYRKENK
jgi:hypothetical protein